MMKAKLLKLAALSASLGSVAGANAAGVDVTAVVTSIGEQAGSVALIGAAVLTLIVGIKAFKWVRRAL
jgi:hypothetical protein